MKVVIAEWLKCKKATFELFMFIICNVIWYVADAYMLIYITQALNEGDLRKGLITVAAFCMIRDCDCIFVMDNGRIAEYGTHEYLMNRQGIYASMCKK